MPGTKPLVSVIIPTYNQSEFISEALDSVLNQDFPQDEIESIIIDDGSTDNTREVISRYKNKVKYFYQQNARKSLAVSQGIKVAEGKYIFILDADDIYLEYKIKKVVDMFENDENITYVSHPVVYWYMYKNIKKEEVFPDEIKNRKINGKDLLHYFFRKNKIFGGGSTAAMRRETVKDISIPSNVDMFIDEFLLLTVLKSGFAFFFDKPLSIYRIHGKNYSTGNIDDKIKDILRANQAILSFILNNDFDKKTKVLYKLKTKVNILRFKEATGKKTFSDVIDVWNYILRIRRLFYKDIFTIIKNYRILQRSFPTFVIRIYHHIRPLK